MQKATYKPNPNNPIVVGEKALVDVINHPTCSHCTVCTTEVLSYDESTGVFMVDVTEFSPVYDAVQEPVQEPVQEVEPDAAALNLPVPEALPALIKPKATKGVK